MGCRISLAAKRELAEQVRRRYRSASGTQKHKILDEFIAVTGYHPKAAIRVLNAQTGAKLPQTRRRSSLYDDAARQALIVLWEASDRVCGKRLRPLLRILLPALERHGHLKLDEAIRAKVLAMSAATIDRMLRTPRRATSGKRPRRVTPEIRRRIQVRTFADWIDPPPGSMEMDLVAHCGEMNKGSYVNSLVLTDIASGWTECAPLVVRESSLLIEALDRVRVSLPFTLKALDVDNGSEFINEAMIRYCLSNGIELTRSRPYRKNDQAWIEQKNGAVVRKLLGYRRFEGIAAAQALARLYGAARLFVNFFQPSFKLAEKHRRGAQVTKRYHPPETPYERLLQGEGIPESTKAKLREVGETLDPLKLLEEVRAMQAHMVMIAEGGKAEMPNGQRPDLPAFLSSLSGAWREGEVRPTHAAQVQTRYLRPLTAALPRPAPPHQPKVVPKSVPAVTPVRTSTPQLDAEIERRCELQRQDFARRHIRRLYAYTLIWPLINRRLEACPNLNACVLFDELRAQYPGRFHLGQRAALIHRVKLWREDARARGIVIGKRSNRTSGLARIYRTRADAFLADWPELCDWLGEDPDQTGLELFARLKAKYPDRYVDGQLRTLQRRLKTWRREAVQRLICEMHDFTEDVSAGA